MDCKKRIIRNVEVSCNLSLSLLLSSTDFLCLEVQRGFFSSLLLFKEIT